MSVQITRLKDVILPVFLFDLKAYLIRGSLESTNNGSRTDSSGLEAINIKQSVLLILFFCFDH